MNRVFIEYTSDDIRKLEKETKGISPYLGYVYAVEFGDAVKIGSTEKPYQRYMQLMANANYAQKRLGETILLTPSHTNFRENERKVHDYFDNNRVKRTELFRVTLDEVKNEISLILEDKSLELEERAKGFVEGAKELFFGKLCNEESNNDDIDGKYADDTLEYILKRLLYLSLAGECYKSAFCSSIAYENVRSELQLPYIPCDEKELDELLGLYCIFEDEDVEQFVNFIISKGIAEKDEFGSLVIKETYYGYNLEKQNGEHTAVWYSYTFGLIMSDYYKFIN